MYENSNISADTGEIFNFIFDQPGELFNDQQQEEVPENRDISTDRREFFNVQKEEEEEAENEHALNSKGTCIRPFPPSSRSYIYAERIQITGPEGISFVVIVIFRGGENAFVIASNRWKKFVSRSGLRPLDAIRFYRPVPAAPKNHFLVDYVRRANQQIMCVPELKPQNFLFQLNFTNTANTYRLLSIPAEEVRNHFHAIGIPVEVLVIARLHFTDALNNDWPMKIAIIVPTPTNVQHMFLLSDKFVTENDLEVGDLIRFYKPVQPLHSRHYHIEFVKGAGQMLELSQISGLAAKDGNGDDDGDGTGGGGNRKGDDKGMSGHGKRQGDGGGGSSSRSSPKRRKTR